MKLALLLVAACEFVPAPPPAPAPVARVVDAAVADGDGGVVDAAAIAATPECIATATHIADVLIASQTDATLKSSYETARDRLIKATAEVCTSQHWPKDELACFDEAKLEADLHACEKKFPPPR
ncbi:MAG: hypothetical protein QM831_39000 [Kofleriaceae bacterium]